MRQLRWLIAGTASAAIALAGLTGSTAASAAPAASHPSLQMTNQPAIHLPGHVAGPGGITVDESSNWSGYVDTPKSGSSFKAVSASYTVPSVNCAKTGSSINAFAYHWVGLDGWSDGTVEQDGVADFCEDGTASYDAWHEMYPAGFSLAFSVTPGDAITSSVTYTASTKIYLLKLTDVTSGQSFSVSAKCGTSTTCNNSSAEVITEGYQSLPTWTGTADFGQENYLAADATDAAGTTGSLSDTSAWNDLESVAYGADSDEPMTQPGQLYQGLSTSKSAFDVAWLRVD
jgi:hypothetical protein